MGRHICHSHRSCVIFPFRPKRVSKLCPHWSGFTHAQLKVMNVLVLLLPFALAAQECGAVLVTENLCRSVRTAPVPAGSDRRVEHSVPMIPSASTVRQCRNGIVVLCLICIYIWSCIKEIHGFLTHVKLVYWCNQSIGGTNQLTRKKDWCVLVGKVFVCV